VWRLGIKRLLVLVAVATAVLVAAVPAYAWEQTYFNDEDNHVCVGPGEGSVSAWQSNLAYNFTTGWTTCGQQYSGLPSMGVTYMRSDGTTYPYLWSDDFTQGPSDTRTIAYGLAICKHGGNQNGTTYYFCHTSQ